ncbi:MAG: ligase, NAD-dependent, ligase protein [Candidatus Saccharibacteria bacterium]|nr:ligase, NAD-dependent, ligase protein [Candidatus Saccharibacteria bacterium]
MTKLSREQAAERLQKLRPLINEYRYQYAVHDTSTMSEAAADSLKHELTELESQYPDLITPDSPSQRVAGAPLDKFQSVPHSQRMLSLNDAFDEAETGAWKERITKLVPEGTKLEYFMDIKMDGLACALIYEDGMLVRAVTRGDGFVGEDVTMNVRTIESVPLRLRVEKGFEHLTKGRTEVRGEIVMYKADFEKLNEERTEKGLPLFANPRNTAAGTIRQLDPKLVSERKLHFHAYDLLREDTDDVPTNEFAYQALRSLGFLANRDATVTDSVEGVIKFASTWETKRQELSFNTDGLVVKVNDRRVFRDLGVVGKAPRGAVAYKYPAEQSTTKVKDIFVSIGRTGAATPVAMLEPVVVAGSTVQMATLHNEGEIKRKDIRVGDTVIVHKAGDIIPEIVEALKTLRDGSEKEFIMPTHCPDCNTELKKLKADEAVWRCPNESCPSRVWKRVQHYASKGALDIEGLGEKNVIALIDSGLVKDTPDIYILKKEDLLTLDRFAEISATKLVNAIQDKKTPPLDRFLFGLGIRHVGTQTARDLAQAFHTLEALSEATIDELSEVEGVGEVVAESIVEWFSEPENKGILEKFKTFDVWPLEAAHASGPLVGKKFVVTGTLESMGRDQAGDKIKALGGTFQSSVGKDTDYLVVGANVGASKLKKAEKFGTKQINEQELLDILRG